MKLLVVGATGAIGSAVAIAGLDAGHEVTAYVRSPEKLGEIAERLTVARGDVMDAEALAAAVAGHDAVINALGSSPRKEELDIPATAMRSLLAGMDRSGVARLVGLSGAATNVPGETKPIADQIASRLVQLMARNVVEAKQREFDVVAASDVDWTMVRPPRVVQGPATGAVELAEKLRGFQVTTGDVGRLMVELATTGDWVRRAPYISRRAT